MAPLVVASARRAEPAQLDRVYRHLLKEHPLEERHREHLSRERGLSAEAIAQRGYRSWGWCRSERGPMAQRVYERQGSATLDTPGVWVRYQRGREYVTLAGAAGIAIPVRDADGRVVAMQIRNDQAGNGKYSWLSSTKKGGPGPGTPAHVARPRENPAGTGRVWLTEGPLKADVAAERLGEIVVAIPGVSADRDFLPTLERLRDRGELRELVVALDADWRDKEAVGKARALLAERAARVGVPVALADWLGVWKGLDDLLLAGKRPKLTDFQVAGNGPRPLEEVAVVAGPIAPLEQALELGVARRKQGKALDDWMEERQAGGAPRLVLLQSPPGVGKSHTITQSVNRYVKRHRRARVSVMVPRHEMAAAPGREEWGVVRGRGHVSAAQPEPPCRMGAAQSRLQQLRIAGQLGCERCPLQARCRENPARVGDEPFYLNQFGNRKAVTVYPVQHFLTPTLWQGARFLVLDDCSLDALCLEEVELSRVELEGALDWAERHPEHGYARAQPMLRLLVELGRTTPFGEMSWSGTELFLRLVVLAESFKVDLGALLEEAGSAEEPDPFGGQELGQARLDVPRRFVRELAQVLAHELRLYRTRDEREREGWNRRVWLEREPGQDVQLKLRLRRELPRQALAGQDIVLADASLTVEEARERFPEHQVSVIHMRVAMPDSVEIHQMVDQSWGKRRLADPNVRERALGEIGKVLERHSGARVGLITHKSFTREVRARFPELLVGHYFGQRGSNLFETCDVLVCFGTPFPNSEQLERQAEALHWDEPALRRQITLEQRAFEVRPGQAGLATRVRSYADSRLKRLLRGKSEDELLQAIYRIRPLSVQGCYRARPEDQMLFDFVEAPKSAARPERQRAFVYVFSSLPLPGLRVQLHRAAPAAPATVTDLAEAATRLRERREWVTERRVALEARATLHRVRSWKHELASARSDLGSLVPPAHGPPAERTA